MKRMKQLIKRFEKMHPGYDVYFDELESCPGFYHIAITNRIFKLTSWYIFETCKGFEDWMKGVVLDG